MIVKVCIAATTKPSPYVRRKWKATSYYELRGFWWNLEAATPVQRVSENRQRPLSLRVRDRQLKVLSEERACDLR
ncbi:hypothetical protein EVAR_51477_1 [Eumeta japonica]|uniref:Uncharacterized protein n=1 Tax=Eumeta variegata TaxID=151549 RepID=A0A4C1Z753_EUMVA|nr:hypothetical protein EVAR_51477_1 [Eumeta japonica]